MQQQTKDDDRDDGIRRHAGSNAEANAATRTHFGALRTRPFTAWDILAWFAACLTLAYLNSRILPTFANFAFWLGGALGSLIYVQFRRLPRPLGALFLALWTIYALLVTGVLVAFGYPDA